MNSNSPTGKLSVQDLLKPRYLVKADYPMSVFEVGEILYWHNTGKTGWGLNDGYYTLYEEFRPVSTIKCFLPANIEPFPHLFRKLSWHELRSVEQLPDFLKDEYGEIWKVKEYKIWKDVTPSTTVLLYKNFKDEEMPYGDHSLYELQPTTKTDFDNYQKTKTKEK